MFLDQRNVESKVCQYVQMSVAYVNLCDVFV